MKTFPYNGKRNISGERIREARLRQRISQTELAARLQTEGIIIEQDRTWDEAGAGLRAEGHRPGTEGICRLARRKLLNR